MEEEVSETVGSFMVVGRSMTSVFENLSWLGVKYLYKVQLLVKMVQTMVGLGSVVVESGLLTNRGQGNVR